MRYGWLLIPLVVVACAKGEQAQGNAEEAAPAALTDAAVAGTWTCCFRRASSTPHR